MTLLKVTNRPLGLGANIPILEFLYESFRIAHIRCLCNTNILFYAYR